MTDSFGTHQTSEIIPSKRTNDLAVFLPLRLAQNNLLRLRDDANRSAEQLLNRINRAEEAQRQETLRQEAANRQTGYGSLAFRRHTYGRSADVRSPAEIQRMREEREAFRNQAAAQQRVLDQHDDLYTLREEVQRLKAELKKNNADLERAETPPLAVIQSLPKNDQLANSVAWFGRSLMLFPFLLLVVYTIIDRDTSELLHPFMKGVMTIPWFKRV